MAAMHRAYGVLLVATLGVTASSLSAQASADVTKAAAAITKEDIAHHVGVIADDSMMGRDTPSPGLEMTAQYVADQFKKFGLKPGGDKGSWFQRFDVEGGTAPNTVGILEGSDPKLKDEYLVMSAHMDHIGISSGQADSINNGANDDGSGTTGIIELAKAFSQLGTRPKRSIIFLTVSGEEKGLWGSEHFAEHPPVPIKQIVADINFDMIGRGETDSTILVIGLEHSDLGATFERLNGAHRDLRINAIPNPPPGRLYSSDHYNFARRGVPIIKFGGPSESVDLDYHQVTDSPEKIETEREARILRLAFYIGHDVANADQRPQWNPDSYKTIVDKPGD